MRPNRKLLSVGLAILACCIFSLAYSLLGAGGGGRGSDASLNGQRGPSADRLMMIDSSLRLESWGECFQSAPVLFLAVASLQADHVGRRDLRAAWRKWRVGHNTAQLMFFLRYSETANRPATIEEFHASQDVIVDSRLPRQTDLAMLQTAAAWFLDRCPRTPYLLFVSHGAGINPRLVSLHATGGVANGAAAKLAPGLASVGANSTDADMARLPRCLLLHRDSVGLVERWPTTWAEMLTVVGFNASVVDATRLFCSRDNSGR